MQIQEAIDAYSYAILPLAEGTQVWYLGKLKQFADWCDSQNLQLEQITQTHLRKYLHQLSLTTSTRTTKPLSSYTVHGAARAIRTFLKWCSQEDGIEHLVTEKTASKMTMPKVEEKIISIFTQEQIAAFFVACDKEYAEHIIVRDKAILSLLLDTGIRASELTTLTLEHVHLDPKDAFVKVLGKGRKEREIGLGKDTRILLHKYISRFRNATHTVPSATREVFLSRFCKPLTVSGLDQLIYRLAEWVGITGVRCSAHTFRHTYAVEYLKNGGDIFKLSRLMGHTSVQTTMIYLKCFQAKDARRDGPSVMDTLNVKSRKKGSRK